MNKKLFTAVSAALVLFLLGSCNSGFSGKETTPFDGIPDGELVTPYAGTEVLRSVRSASETDNDLVDWKVARFFAVVEKVKANALYDWKGTKLSEKPVIIYYPESNKPKYYEFRVIKDGKEVGSITCHASKAEGDFVAYVSEMTHRVSAAVARDLVSLRGDKKLSAVNYPNSFVMSERAASLENANFKDALTQTAIPAETVFVEKHADVFLKEASAETLAKMEITEEAKAEMLADISERKAMFADLWADVDKSKEKILAITDEEIEKAFENAVAEAPQAEPGNITIKKSWIETNEVYRKSLNDWVDKKDWFIYDRKTWCGPAAVTFVALGLGSKSGCSYVPLVNDSEKIKALYDKFESVIGTGPKVISSLDRGLRYYTNYRIEQKLGHRWASVDDHLCDYNLPVISLRSGWYGDWGFHYRTVIRTAKDERRIYNEIWWYWFGWKSHRWSTYLSTTRWYYMHDNGSDSDRSGNFWEKAGLPCQSTLGLVKRK